VLLAILAAAACGGGGSDARGGAENAKASAAPDPAPSTEAEFLQALAPLPGAGVRVVYDVDGPGSLDGTLEILARPGGFRRENWALTRPSTDGAVRQVRGSTIQTPSASWSGIEGEAGTKTASPLEGLARAYLALEPASRAAAAENLRRWHADLRQARTEHPGDVREIAGTGCLQMRVAAQDLCLWEEAGLALEYRGAEFTVVATRIELDTAIEDGAFALPERAAQARTVALPAAFDLDPEAGMRALVAGDYGPLAAVLTPGLRMPLPDAR
jgi:hypothetical protein